MPGCRGLCRSVDELPRPGVWACVTWMLTGRANGLPGGTVFTKWDHTTQTLCDFA